MRKRLGKVLGVAVWFWLAWEGQFAIGAALYALAAFIGCFLLWSFVWWLLLGWVPDPILRPNDMKRAKKDLAEKWQNRPVLSGRIKRIGGLVVFLLYIAAWGHASAHFNLVPAEDPLHQYQYLGEFLWGVFLLAWAVPFVLWGGGWVLYFAFAFVMEGLTWLWNGDGTDERKEIARNAMDEVDENLIAAADADLIAADLAAARAEVERIDRLYES